MAARRWADHEDARLRDLYRTHTREQIAKALGRTEGMVRSRCWTLGLNSKSAGDWSEAELTRLREAYAAATNERLDIEALARELGRTKASVFLKASRLGLGDFSRRKKDVIKGPRKPIYETEEERRKANSEHVKRMWMERPHPRGMLGKKHKPELKRAISEMSRRMWADPNSKLNSPEQSQRRSDQLTRRQLLNGPMGGEKTFSRCRRGRRSDLGGIFFRSAWEANYARYLNWLVARGEVVSWNFEQTVFEFYEEKRKYRSYMPDFRVEFPGGRIEWHEVKGWMTEKGRKKLELMAKYYPDEVIVVVGKDFFFRAERASDLADLIPNWERRSARSDRRRPLQRK